MSPRKVRDPRECLLVRHPLGPTSTRRPTPGGAGPDILVLMLVGALERRTTPRTSLHRTEKWKGLPWWRDKNHSSGERRVNPPTGSSPVVLIPGETERPVPTHVCPRVWDTQTRPTGRPVSRVMDEDTGGRAP